MHIFAGVNFKIFGFMLLLSKKKRNSQNGKTLTLKDVRETKHALTLFKALDQQQHNICLFALKDNAGIVTAYDSEEDLAAAKKKFQKQIKNEPNKPWLLLVMAPAGRYLYDYYPRNTPFPKNERSRASALKVFRELKTAKFIEESLQENDWLYIFGYEEEKSHPTINIKWMASKESLNYFLRKWFEKEIESKKLKISSISAIVPMVILDKKGKNMTLGKKRKENSDRYDIIDNIFRHIEND